MRTNLEIIKMFEDMDLGTEEKRARFFFSYSYNNENSYKSVPFFRADTRTVEIMEEDNAKLE